MVLPVAEEVMQVGDCIELVVAGNVRCILESFSEDVESVNGPVARWH